MPWLRTGRVWRFDKDVVDRWMGGGQVGDAGDLGDVIYEGKVRTKVAMRRGLGVVDWNEI